MNHENEDIFQGFTGRMIRYGTTDCVASYLYDADSEEFVLFLVRLWPM